MIFESILKFNFRKKRKLFEYVCWNIVIFGNCGKLENRARISFLK